MSLPIVDQQLLLCAYEECELWQLMSGIGEVAPIKTQREQLELSQQLLLKYLENGWVAIARARNDEGKWDPRGISVRDARDFVLSEANWTVPTEESPNPGCPLVTVLTQEGKKALEAGAAAEAFARIPRPKGS